MSEESRNKDCEFPRLRDYPGCFEDCPDTDRCPNGGSQTKRVPLEFAPNLKDIPDGYEPKPGIGPYEIPHATHDKYFTPPDKPKGDIELPIDSHEDLLSAYGSEVMAAVQNNKLDRLPGLLEQATSIQQDLTRKECQACVERIFREIEKGVCYVDTRGYMALKPKASENWQALKKDEEEERTKIAKSNAIGN